MPPRPKQDRSKVRAHHVSMRVDSATLAALKTIGNGNLSAGVRLAVAAAKVNGLTVKEGK